MVIISDACGFGWWLWLLISIAGHEVLANCSYSPTADGSNGQRCQNKLVILQVIVRNPGGSPDHLGPYDQSLEFWGLAILPFLLRTFGEFWRWESQGEMMDNHMIRLIITSFMLKLTTVSMSNCWTLQAYHSEVRLAEEWLTCDCRIATFPTHTWTRKYNPPLRINSRWCRV